MFVVSGSPHVHSHDTTGNMMWRVCLALSPAFLVSVAYFGLNALLTTLVSVGVCVLIQWLIEKYIMKRPTTIQDGSAVVTGILLAFNVPATSDMIWIVSIGALFAIGVAKMAFGGIGRNPFNPALAGRVFMLVSFPVEMTTWPVVGKWFPMGLDTVSGPTPLGMIKEGLKTGSPIDLPGVWQMLLGQMGGSLGEVSAIAVLIGAVYLLVSGVISWHTPVSFIGTAFVFSGILWLVDPSMYIDPVTTLLTGGLLLGACFMATDMSTSPMIKSGQIVFGIGCGLLTIIIRNWGVYPEGVSFAILLMNAVTPLINKVCHPKRFAD